MDLDVRRRLREVEEEIVARAPEHDIDPTTDRVRALLEVLGDPHRTYPVVHITGTNGKTSTARMIERLLLELGLRSGRFTSPHLHDIRERIVLSGELVEARRFVEAYDEIAPLLALVEQRSLEAGTGRFSFFEVLVAMGYAIFADAPVDVAVVEVGMGGVWDATNVADGAVAVITPIALDHERYLGSEVEDIAGEKSGIIKPGAIVVSAAQEIGAAEVLRQRAEQVGASIAWDVTEGTAGGEGTAGLAVLARDVAIGGQMLTLRGLAGDYPDLFLPLHGEHQAHNALLALAAVEALVGGGEQPLDLEVVRAAFAAVESPGRLEIVRRSPTVLVDAAHNPHGMEALVPAVEETFGLSHLVAVVGVMADKDAESMLSVLEPACEAVVCVPIDSPRAMEPEDLAEVAREVFGADRVELGDTLAAGVEQAVTLAESFDAPMPATGVLIVGSVLLAAEARALFGRA